MVSLDNVAPLTKLLDVMAKMRNHKEGCAWTKDQSWDSLVRHTIEEAYEVADAVERGSVEDLKGELADLLNQIIFYAQIAKENGYFDFIEIMDYLTAKLIKRHPDVFAQGKITTVNELETQWEKIKKLERLNKEDLNKKKTESTLNSILDDVALNLPALSRAKKLQVRASSVGFDWLKLDDVFDKLKSEVIEVEEALKLKRQSDVLDEIGDLMFCCVNLIRHLRADPEQIMRKANHKFEKRFRSMEQIQAVKDKDLSEADILEMERLWQQAKNLE